MYVYIALFALGAYLLGAIPTGLVLARLFSATDIRAGGSGNIGATNVLRLLGRKFGALTLLGDMLKGFLPVYTGSLLFPDAAGGTDNMILSLFGLAAFLGHLFPVYLKFKGGKGVATAFGVFAWLAPAALVLVLVLFVIVVAVSRYVSLASLSAAVVLPLLLLTYSYPLPVVLTGIIMGLLVFIKHKNNIQRLLQGTENKQGAS
ncbi:MAG: glycerol-3-phosphate 1-O-acyltransferase PlsY [Deltaproteobacteria bacterium]|nr:glycerol-3-phosphate 1-O-acyltransferase PlsY [Deltaproteobacteria bacterium]